jgi:hypothetical protein
MISGFCLDGLSKFTKSSVRRSELRAYISTVAIPHMNKAFDLLYCDLCLRELLAVYN